MGAIHWNRVFGDGLVWLSTCLLAGWILYRLHVISLKAIAVLRKQEDCETDSLLRSAQAQEGFDEEIGTIESPKKKSHLQVPWNFFTAWGGFFPLSGMLACLAVSLLHNYAQVTNTHCAPRYGNFMPSISACIGDYGPQRFIWGVSIAMGVPMRTVSGWVFRSHYSDFKQLMGKANLRFALYFGEQFGLVLLTVVTSSHSLVVHQVGFGMFSACSVCSMVVTCRMLRDRKRLKQAIDEEYLSTFLAWNDPRRNKSYVPDSTASEAMFEISRQVREKLCVFNIAALLFALYWYLVHDSRCGQYYYSYFAICEWSFVLSNVAFHMVELLDLSQYKLSLLPSDLDSAY